MEQPTAGNGCLRRRLNVEYPLTGGHPLRATVTDEAAAALAVVVLQQPIDHVRNRLEPAVRVPRRALGFTRSVVDRPHLI
jgi:hypothetical protein